MPVIVDSSISIPDATSINVYTTHTPSDASNRLDHWGAFKSTATKIRDSGQTLIYSDGSQSLEVFHASDSLWWIEDGDPSGESIPENALINTQTAVPLAQAFIESSGLSTGYEYFESVTYSAFTMLKRTNDGWPDTRLQVPVRVHVNFRYRLDGLPVFGSGAKLRITYADKADPVEALRFWRIPVVLEQRPLIGGMQAIDALIESWQKLASVRGDSGSLAVINSISIGHLALPPRESQTTLIPVYLVMGEVSSADGVTYPLSRYIVAIDYSLEDAKRRGLLNRNPRRII